MLICEGDINNTSVSVFFSVCRHTLVANDTKHQADECQSMLYSWMFHMFDLSTMCKCRSNVGQLECVDFLTVNSSIKMSAQVGGKSMRCQFGSPLCLVVCVMLLNERIGVVGRCEIGAVELLFTN